tara:strand:+ start:409 stop:597 length:189 start_codon:yes stop_codon:yes gene_type:complete
MTIYNNESPDNMNSMINNKKQKSNYEDDNIDSLLKEFDIEDADIDVDIATNDDINELEIFNY